MSSVESPTSQEAALEQGRQLLLRLAFNWASNLIPTSSDRVYQAGNRSYSVRYSDKYTSRLGHPEVNRNEIRILVTLPSGSEIPSQWSEIIPAGSTKDQVDYLFLFGKGEIFQEEKSEDWFSGTYPDEKGQRRTMSLGAITVLSNDLMHILTSLPSQSSTDPVVGTEGLEPPTSSM